MIQSVLLALLAVVTITIQRLPAQVPSASAGGRIISSTGEGVDEALIVLHGEHRKYSAISKDDGTFQIDDVATGEYTITVQRIGFISVSRSCVVTTGPPIRIDVTLPAAPIRSSDITVTATRSRRAVEDVPIVVEVVSQAEIQGARPRQLDDLLAERTGVTVTRDHGAGVQLQGLDADYTLILVNGDPVVGRVAGTLDLGRIQLDNVEKVEIIRGPMSSLYGSEALAGVINVLTRTPDSSYGASINMRAGSHTTIDLGGSMHYASGAWSGLLRLQRSSSEGYDLTPATIAPTLAPYTTWSLQPRLEYRPDPNTDLALVSQLLVSSQRSDVDIAVDRDTLRMQDQTRRTEWSVSQSTRHRFDERVTLGGKLYATRFLTENTISHPGGTYYRSDFDQLYLKGEAQIDVAFSSANLLTAGLGIAHETVGADRIDGGSQRAGSWFLFAQEEWRPWQSANITAGLRFDSHNDYGIRLSPKLSVMYRPSGWLALRGGVGSGFKAPTFQQLHLDFTNPTVGYSVFGSTGIVAGIARLQQEGRIREMLIDVRRIDPLRAESSIAGNAGVEIQLVDGVGLSTNAFLNSVTDLIETAPVAMVQSGQQVFTYFNLNHVITRGIDAQLRLGLVDSFTLVLGYSYLDAYDVGAFDRVQRGEISKTGSSGRLRSVQETEYGGLFNRSRHSATARLSYSNSRIGFTATLRGTVRDRYGYADLNTNGILDDDREYAPGYSLWNLTLSQDLSSGLALFATLDNAFDKTDSRIPSLPGRLLGIGVDWRFE